MGFRSAILIVTAFLIAPVAAGCGSGSQTRRTTQTRRLGCLYRPVQLRQIQRGGYWTAPRIVSRGAEYTAESCRYGPDGFGWTGDYATTVIIMIEQECAEDGSLPGRDPTVLTHEQGFQPDGNLTRVYNFACWKRR